MLYIHNIINEKIITKLLLDVNCSLLFFMFIMDNYNLIIHLFIL
jgi:hypothetical protein